ncbi:MAG: Riboflavin biosynthesis protein RibF [Thermoanaerobacterales bacterium 50_218]|nr:MAG: Riboflavin biosynthesis protein RibF [Thermoanaerobacterales bacterium 50_218]
MRVFKTLEGISLPEKLVVALGNFDGVHLGHRRLLREMVVSCRGEGNVPSVFLFNPHPQKVLSPERAPRMLLDLEKKLDLLESLGVEVVFVVPFNEAVASLTPYQFVKEILVNRLKVLGVYVGFNYRFGKSASGTPEELTNYGKKYGFFVKVLSPVVVDGVVVSSSNIRRALERGDILQAKKLLGYWPLIRGRVVRGDGRGRLLGFPTTNICVDPDLLLPLSGVYAGCAYLEGRSYPAVLNIGKCPTFRETGEITVEAHLLEYEGCAYGKTIEVELYQRLRGERKFSDSSGLVEQIRKDIDEALAICKPVIYTEHKL